MTALTKEQFEDVQRRIGGLGLTEADRKALLREVRQAIKDQQKILKDKDDLSESVWRALEDEVRAGRVIPSAAALQLFDLLTADD